MLAKANRLLTAEDFRGVLRRGKRQTFDGIAVNTVLTSDGVHARFGFVVTKKVGNAVARNQVRRRLKAVARELVTEGLSGVDVVVRAFPASVDASWTSLRGEFRNAMKGVNSP